MKKKKKRAIKKKNFKKIRKAKKALAKLLGGKWKKLPVLIKQILIQFKICKRNMKKFKKRFRFVWRMYLKGRSGKKIAKRLRKKKWAKKHKKAAKQIAKCLKSLKSKP